MNYAVVPPSRKAEALASINSRVFETSWLSNNLGRVEKIVAGHIKKGNKKRALGAIEQYKRKLAELRSVTGMKLEDKVTQQEMQNLEFLANDAFEGSLGEQNRKWKTYSKSSLSKARGRQRNVTKKSK